MRTLIEQGASTFAFPRRAPSAAGIVSFGAKPIRNDAVDPDDLTEFAGIDQVLELLVARFGAQLEHRSESAIRMPFVGGNEALAIRFVNGDRFFNHDVKSGLERRDPKRGMGVMGRANK